ncbi:MAG: hypothetical protein GF416_07960 [Candidatus Altiarchaeales archaeon]|nr:hypothetical protein [Candidatus Altiarchaeales archaeon]MBD3417048.1 hypothetical protein [Candidatus Altiarchaeales archaeon]
MDIGVRGQGGMEYLMTYGWAILVVAIVGIVLWQLGFLKSGSTSITSTGFIKIKPQLSATSLTATGIFTTVFTNTLGADLTVTGVKVYDLNSGSLLCCSHDIPGDCMSAGVIGAASDLGGKNHMQLNAGESVDVSKGRNVKVEMGNLAGGAVTACMIAGGEADDSYNIRVVLLYDLDLGGATGSHTELGTFRGTLE